MLLSQRRTGSQFISDYVAYCNSLGQGQYRNALASGSCHQQRPEELQTRRYRVTVLTLSKRAQLQIHLHSSTNFCKSSRRPNVPRRRQTDFSLAIAA